MTAINVIARGAARNADLFGALYSRRERKIFVNLSNNDARMIMSDWLTVGNDISRSVRQLEKERLSGR